MSLLSPGLFRFALFLNIISQIRAVGYECWPQSNDDKPTGFCYHEPSCKPSTWQYYCQDPNQSPINLSLNVTEHIESAQIIDFPKSSQYLDNMNCYWRGVVYHGEYTTLRNTPRPEFDLYKMYNEKYIFHGMHVHGGKTRGYDSEHTVNGRSFSGELHLVYRSSRYTYIEKAMEASEPNAVLVIAVFLETSGDYREWDTKLLDSFSKSLRSLTKDHSEDLNFRHGSRSEMPFSELFKETFGYAYLYEGSLTTPSCAPARWLVLRKPIIIEEQVLQKFRESNKPYSYLKGENKPDNFRPLQKLGSRQIKLVKLMYS